MPHTNRARRADHYRSLEAPPLAGRNSNEKHSNSSSINHGQRYHKHHQQQEDESNAANQYGGRGSFAAGRGGGRGGRADGGGDQGGGRGQQPKGGKKGSPSVKNRIRSLTRLMNKP
ncbi:unnamed protein product, partial [Sphacelaria rigidula]